MRTIEVKLYKFSELSEKGKQMALESLYDLNVDCKWWDYIYEDAENVGLKITGFDLDRANYCNLELLPGWSYADVKKEILKQHGKDTETHKTVLGYDLRVEENGKWMLGSLSNDYKKMLVDDYNYLTSEEAIIESIEANEYEFTAEGKLYTGE